MTGPEQSGPFLSDEDRETLIHAYQCILVLEPQKERMRLAQTRMYELIMQRSQSRVAQMEQERRLK